MDWSQAGRAHELAEDLSEAAIWLLVRLRSTNKKSEGRFNSKSLDSQTYIRKTFESVGRTLDEVLDELVKAGIIIPQGGTRTKKRLKRIQWNIYSERPWLKGPCMVKLIEMLQKYLMASARQGTYCTEKVWNLGAECRAGTLHQC